MATVDVWRAQLNQSPEWQGRLWDCLDREERARASRFHFQRDQARFVAARGSLRHILAHYLGLWPEQVRLGYAPAGKPFLLDHPDLHFNLSHSEDMLLVGASHGRRIGVDIERIPPDAVVDATSSLVFSPPEMGVLGRLSGRARRERFARFWTRKEAYIKGDGQGMGLELARIDVATSRGRVLLREHSSSEWTASRQWTLRSIPADSGYAAAVAAEGHGWQIRGFSWPESLRQMDAQSRDRRGLDEAASVQAIGRRSGSTQPNLASGDINRSFV